MKKYRKICRKIAGGRTISIGVLVVAGFLLMLSVAWACTGLGTGQAATLTITPNQGSPATKADATIVVAPGIDNLATPILSATKRSAVVAPNVLMPDTMPCGTAAPDHGNPLIGTAGWGGVNTGTWSKPEPGVYVLTGFVPSSIIDSSDQTNLPGKLHWYCAYQPGADALSVSDNWTTNPVLYTTI